MAAITGRTRYRVLLGGTTVLYTSVRRCAIQRARRTTGATVQARPYGAAFGVPWTIIWSN